MAKNTIKDLTLDPKNANKHSEYGTRLLEQSIRENGFGRSVVISSDGVVIAGNGTVEGAAAVGMENVRIIESTGNEIIAVKRTDIKSGTPEFYKLALADNVVAKKNIVLDIEVIEAIVIDYPAVKAWGAIITDPPGQKQRVDDETKPGIVTMKFELSGNQAAKVKEAVKISKELNKPKMDNVDNENANANALFFIIQEYLKAHKPAAKNKASGKKK
jgi:hypothetical protein